MTGPGAPPPADDEPIVEVFTPSLASVLLAREDALGRPLDEAEVDAAVAAAQRERLPVGAALERQRARGFRDLDPDDAYAQYLVVRAHLGRA